MIYGVHYIVEPIPFNELKVGDILYANPKKTEFAYAEITGMSINVYGRPCVNYRYFSSVFGVDPQTVLKSKTYPVLPFRKSYVGTEYRCFAHYGKIVMLGKISGHPATNLFL